MYKTMCRFRVAYSCGSFAHPIPNASDLLAISAESSRDGYCGRVGLQRACGREYVRGGGSHSGAVMRTPLEKRGTLGGHGKHTFVRFTLEFVNSLRRSATDHYYFRSASEGWSAVGVLS